MHPASVAPQIKLEWGEVVEVAAMEIAAAEIMAAEIAAIAIAATEITPMRIATLVPAVPMGVIVMIVVVTLRTGGLRQQAHGSDCGKKQYRPKKHYRPTKMSHGHQAYDLGLQAKPPGAHTESRRMMMPGMQG
jgi:hypothetical protein